MADEKALSPDLKDLRVEAAIQWKINTWARQKSFNSWFIQVTAGWFQNCLKVDDELTKFRVCSWTWSRSGSGVQLYLFTFLGVIPEKCWSWAHTATSHSQTSRYLLSPTLTDMSFHIIAQAGGVGEGVKLNIQATFPFPDGFEGTSCCVLLCWRTPSTRKHNAAWPGLSVPPPEPPGPATCYNLLLLLQAVFASSGLIRTVSELLQEGNRSFSFIFHSRFIGRLFQSPGWR